MDANGQMVISEILKALDIKAPTFAKKTGLASPNVYSLLNGKIKSVSEKSADKIVRVYPQFSKSWIMTASGDMYAADGSQDLIKEEAEDAPVVSQPEDTGVTSTIKERKKYIDALRNAGKGRKVLPKERKEPVSGTQKPDVTVSDRLSANMDDFDLSYQYLAASFKARFLEQEKKINELKYLVESQKLTIELLKEKLKQHSSEE
jgi:plasmid maintenance system antidote protein VapI